MKVAVSGSHGLIGSALVRRLEDEGMDVARLARGPYTASDVEGAGAIIHLAGAGIGARRWSTTYKEELRLSRIASTASLADAVAATAGADNRRPVLVVASAVGYYGFDAGERECTEDRAAGNDFLARLCLDWEAAAEPARRAGARVVHTRFGLVLSAAGGVLARQRPLFRIGLGGRIGSGRQVLSWISRRDAVEAILHLLTRTDASGAYNVTGPVPVTNAEMTRALGRALGRPTVVPAPALALRAAFGREMTEVALLASQRAIPARLEASGFEFAHRDLHSGLQAALADGT